jgi:hypothetical protein
MTRLLTILFFACFSCNAQEGSLFYFGDTLQLPFGSPHLNNNNKLIGTTNIPYSKDLHEDANVELKKPFFDLFGYYFKYHPFEEEPPLGFPSISSWEFIKINENDVFNSEYWMFSGENTSLRSFNTHYYCLPDIQGYKVYYLVSRNGTTHCYSSEYSFEQFPKSVYDDCEAEGVLMFYNVKDRSAKLLNVFYQVKDNDIQNRFFYITKQGEIQTYRLSSGYSFQERYYNQGAYFKSSFDKDEGIIQFNLYPESKIQVQPKGEIVVNRIEDICKDEESSYVKYSLPIGPSDLIGHEFPNEAFTIRTPIQTKKVESLYQEKLHDIWSWYLSFNRSNENRICLPPISEIVNPNQFFDEEALIIMKDDFNNYESIIYEFEEINYASGFKNLSFGKRLPNMGAFELYYALIGDENDDFGCFADWYKTSKNCCSAVFYECDIKGILIIYDRNTQHAVLLNIFNTDKLSNVINFRFFYVTEAGEIKLYDGSSNHEFRHESLKIINGISTIYHDTINGFVTDYKDDGTYIIKHAYTITGTKNQKISIKK